MNLHGDFFQMSMFNQKGELNASSLKDALAEIAKYASAMEDGPSNKGLVSNLNDSQRDELIERAISTQDGKLALAQSIE
jgi:hypothetical protein